MPDNIVYQLNIAVKKISVEAKVLTTKHIKITNKYSIT